MKQSKYRTDFLFGFVLAIVLICTIGIALIMRPKTSHNTVALQTQHPVSQELMIPAIKLHVPIKTQLTAANMKTSVCQTTESSYPGMRGNLILAGHNYNNKTLFSNLDQVKKGQLIIINHYYVYQIDNIKIVKATTTFKSDKVARITLYTCLKENNPEYRLIITGHLIKREEYHNENEN